MRASTASQRACVREAEVTMGEEGGQCLRGDGTPSSTWKDQEFGQMGRPQQDTADRAEGHTARRSRKGQGSGATRKAGGGHSQGPSGHAGPLQHEPPALSRWFSQCWGGRPRGPISFLWDRRGGLKPQKRVLSQPCSPGVGARSRKSRCCQGHAPGGSRGGPFLVPRSARWLPAPLGVAASLQSPSTWPPPHACLFRLP